MFFTLSIRFINALQDHLDDCKKCKGKGAVPKWITPGGYYSDIETVDCPICGRLRREWRKVKRGE
jgi:hypothetical protein